MSLENNNKGKKILIVEDDLQLREELKEFLCNNGYEALILKNFKTSCTDILNTNADLVLLDINLPGINGESLLRKIRKESDVPIIMVTSKNTEMDELLCMSFGADDFIAKPYNPSILLLHIEAIFKRVGRVNDVLEYGNIHLDTHRGTMEVHGEITELSKNEIKILAYLIKHKGQIVSRDELISYLWDTEEFVDDNTLTVNINRVRKKLEDNGLNNVIKTKRGQGYLIG